MKYRVEMFATLAATLILGLAVPHAWAQQDQAPPVPPPPAAEAPAPPAAPVAAPAGKATLGVGAVKATDSVMVAAQNANTLLSLNRVMQAMDGQLIDRLQNTRKFTIIGRSDLADLLKEQNPGAATAADRDDASAAHAFQMVGCKFLVITTIDNFQDYVEQAHFEAMGETGHRRVVQFSAVCKVYETLTAKLVESTNLQLSNVGVDRTEAGITTHGDLKDEMLPMMARMMAQKVADRVVDVLYPAKVITKTGSIVTINRGDGTNIAPGQVWEAFSQGQELKDPDTGASLGHEEVKIGAVRVTDVQPMFSRGEVVEDHGIGQGIVLRRVDTASPLPGMPPGPPPMPPPGR